ncbi:ABC transporter substrate-binding protein [Umezawaea sp. NPDC059074]|uniref:ABC transporter substrate-binding protein n=1 Tax=Umezawaea sp. NPDC059074 TaxID=3346716 RepID=UPI00367FABEE
MQGIRRRTALALAGTIAVALVAAACSSGGATKSAASGVLTVGMPNGPQTNNSNPFLATSAGASLGYRFMIYEPLVQTNPIAPSEKGTPWLAEKWEWADNYQKLTITTRKDVKWSDDKPFTAADVAFTFGLLKDKSALNTNGLPIAGATKVSDTSAEITFSKPQFVNENKILNSFIVPEHIWKDVPDPTTFTNETPVGTGPYSLKTFTPQTVTLSVRSSYWQELPKVPEIQYTSYNDNSAQTTALASGAAQWSYVFMPNFETLYVNKDPKNHKIWMPAGLGIHALWLNTAKAPFNNVAVRKALNMVIDREVIFQQGHSKLFPKVDNVTGIPSPAGDPFLSADYKGKTAKVDVEGAKKVLTEAGYKLDGDTLKDPSGAPVTFALTDPAGWSDYLTDLDIIKNAVKALGITAEVKTQTVDQWTTDFNSGAFDATMHWTNSGATPFETYQNIMDASASKPIGEPAASAQGRFNDPAATSALTAYASAPDDAARKTNLDLLQKIFVEQVPAIPLVSSPVGAEYSTKSWIGWPTAEDPYAPPQPTQTNALQVVLRLKPATA